MKITKRKKAFLGDLFLYIIILFSLSIVIVTAFIMLDSFNTAWQASDNIPLVSKQIVAFQAEKFGPVWDANMAVWAIGYIIAIVITAFALRSHPVFAMLAVVVLIVLGLVAVQLSNAYFSFASTSEIAPFSSVFTKTTFINNNLPIFVAGLGLIFIIVLYAKTRNQIPAL